MSSEHILVVDDDSRLRDLLRRYLDAEGFRVSLAADAAEARQHLANITFDLAVMDIMMPGEDGLALTRALQNDRPGLPVLLLSARGEAEDRIEGLASGADDYLSKPFEPRELVLRINAILKRAQRDRAEEPTLSALTFGPFQFDLTRQELTREGAFVYLTEAETELLATLARNAGQAVEREALAGGGDAGNLRSVDVQITRLRRKIEEDPKFPRYLQTVRGTGYILLPD